MKRGIKALCKYLIVSISTIVATVIVFNIFRNNESPRGNHGILQGQGKSPIEPESLRLERDSMYVADTSKNKDLKIDWHNYEHIAAESKRVGKFFL